MRISAFLVRVDVYVHHEPCLFTYGTSRSNVVLGSSGSVSCTMITRPPALLVFKGGELHSKIRLSDAGDRLSAWMLEHRLPLALELSPDNFQDVMNAPHKPLVVITATTLKDKAKVAKDLTDVARRWRDAKEQVPVVFTWMDADRWGSWLKSMYGLKADSLPRAVVANHTVRCSIRYRRVDD